MHRAIDIWKFDTNLSALKLSEFKEFVLNQNEREGSMLLVLMSLSQDVELWRKFMDLASRSVGKTELLQWVESSTPQKLVPLVRKVFHLDNDKEALHIASKIKKGYQIYRDGGVGDSPRLNVVFSDECKIKLWEWGASDSVSSCSGGDLCFGTALNEYYPSYADDTIKSPPLDLSAYDVARVIFSHYYVTEATYDYGKVLCSADGGNTWISVSASYSGSSGGWVVDTVDISSCISTSTVIAFAFHSDGTTQNLGWYLDDIYVEGSSYSAYDILYSSSFEGSDDGDLSPIGDSLAPWERGVPSSGPGSAYDGVRVWATNLNGDYNNDADESLTKQTPISLTGYNRYTLEFYQWYAIEDGYDKGFVEVSVDGGSTWDTLGIYTGSQTSWQKVSLDLTNYAGNDLLFRFRFKSDGSVTYEGWYIDSINLYGVDLAPFSQVAYYSFDASDEGFIASGFVRGNPYPISNSYLTWWVDINPGADFGTYTAETGDNHVYPHITLLYGGSYPSAWSSWTTIHSENSGIDYIGKNGTATTPSGYDQANLKNFAAQVTCDTANKLLEIVYDIDTAGDRLTVKEVFWVEGTYSNNSFLWHRTTVINNSLFNIASVGIRWEYDTHVDATDHPAHYQCKYDTVLRDLLCSDEIPTPIQVGPPVPDTFNYLRESDANPPVGDKYHVFALVDENDSVSTPDFVYHTRWPNAHDNTWTYTLSTDDITVETGYDNAFVYFWDVQPILPGDSISVIVPIGSVLTPTPIYDRETLEEMGVIFRDGRLILKNITSPIEVALYDVAGKLLRKETLTPRKNWMEWRKPGVYIVRVGMRVFKTVIR